MCIRKGILVRQPEESQHVKNVRNWLNALDKQDGKTDGFIDASVWSKYESKFGVKSKAHFQPSGEGGLARRVRRGIFIDDVISVIKAKRGE